jgi:hypothetical protein
MGKTSLSRAVWHHPEVTARYDQHRFFVPCDTVSTSIQLACLIGTHIGLKAGKDLTGPVIHHFSSGPPTLLILDNLETIWEPAESHADVEKFLCCLTNVEHLALIVSMEPDVFSSGTNKYNCRSQCEEQKDLPMCGGLAPS